MSSGSNLNFKKWHQIRNQWVPKRLNTKLGLDPINIIGFIINFGVLGIPVSSMYTAEFSLTHIPVTLSHLNQIKLIKKKVVESGSTTLQKNLSNGLLFLTVLSKV